MDMTGVIIILVFMCAFGALMWLDASVTQKRLDESKRKYEDEATTDNKGRNR